MLLRVSSNEDWNYTNWNTIISMYQNIHIPSVSRDKFSFSQFFLPFQEVVDNKHNWLHTLRKREHKYLTKLEKSRKFPKQSPNWHPLVRTHSMNHFGQALVVCKTKRRRRESYICLKCKKPRENHRTHAWGGAWW